MYSHCPSFRYADLVRPCKRDIIWFRLPIHMIQKDQWLPSESSALCFDTLVKHSPPSIDLARVYKKPKRLALEDDVFVFALIQHVSPTSISTSDPTIRAILDVFLLLGGDLGLSGLGISFLLPLNLFQSEELLSVEPGANGVISSNMKAKMERQREGRVWRLTGPSRPTRN
jgi:hypothetical protein